MLKLHIAHFSYSLYIARIFFGYILVNAFTVEITFIGFA